MVYDKIHKKLRINVTEVSLLPGEGEDHTTKICVVLFEGGLPFQLPDRQHCSCGVIGQLHGRGVHLRMEQLLVLDPQSTTK